MNHRVGRLLFGFGVGLLAAFLAFRWAAEIGPRAERDLQEAAVIASRALLEDTLAIGQLELVDPLAPDRVVGKGYIYPSGDGWQVSGFYRRNPQDLWHPYLITLDSELDLAHLKVSDSALLDRQAERENVEILP